MLEASKKEGAMFFGLFRDPPLQLVIDHGRVGCPVRQRDVEIDACGQCPRFDEVDEHAKIPVLKCRPQGGLMDTQGY